MARMSEKFNPLLKSYPDSKKINSVSEGAEVLYVRLLAASDDKGRYFGDPAWILSRLFTQRHHAGQLDCAEIERRLNELANSSPGPLLRRYTVEGTQFLELINCMKCLRKDVNPQVLFPSDVPESETVRSEASTPTATRTETQPEPRPNHNQNPNHNRRSGLLQVTGEDLANTGLLMERLELEASKQQPMVSDCDRDRLRILGAAERAIEVGNNPPKLFVSIVKQGNWHLISNEQEDRANVRLKEFRAQKPVGEFGSMVGRNLTANGEANGQGEN